LVPQPTALKQPVALQPAQPLLALLQLVPAQWADMQPAVQPMVPLQLAPPLRVVRLTVAQPTVVKLLAVMPLVVSPWVVVHMVD
jgi:hypothetical protein